MLARSRYIAKPAISKLYPSRLEVSFQGNFGGIKASLTHLISISMSAFPGNPSTSIVLTLLTPHQTQQPCPANKH